MELKDFVKKYIDHNTLVKIYIERELFYEPVWTGMAWQISDDEFLPVHNDAEHCPYRNYTNYQLCGDDGMFIVIKEENENETQEN